MIKAVTLVIAITLITGYFLFGIQAVSDWAGETPQDTNEPTFTLEERQAMAQIWSFTLIFLIALLILLIGGWLDRFMK